MRILLFLLTNIAIMVVVGLLFHLLGLGQFMQQRGVGLNLTHLLIVSAFMGMTGSFISLFISKWMAKRSMGVFVIERPSNPTETWLVETVRRLSKQAGIGMPEVGIFDSHEPNAFATGASRDNALVAVSSGLLHNMNQSEVEAVLGHEISHVANGDMVTMTLIQGVVNTFVYFLATIAGYVVDRTLLRSDNEESGGFGPAYYITQMVAQIVLGILASMIVMWFSRWREFRADAGGASLAGRAKMIAALHALQRAKDPTEMPAEMMAFGIRGGGNGWMELFMSHPPLEKRIAALESGQQH
ncbi:MAG: protease HtpX [Methylococcaceae bacterium]|nr:MAG: protease HtpX [Methylococcaceae bacterium]